MRDLALKQGVRWEIFPIRNSSTMPAIAWVVEYDSREVDPVYRQAITYLDKQLSLPDLREEFRLARRRESMPRSRSAR